MIFVPLRLSSLTTAFNGAEPIRAETIKQFCEAFAARGFRPEAAFPCYGMAEATLFVSGGPNNRVAPISSISNAAIEKNKVVFA
jgi:acyl-CoA synthetase (AMP-forming)/AMP-acid ligase II